MRLAVVAAVVAAALASHVDARPTAQSEKPYLPRSAVGVFASANYAVTFLAPEDAFYCPIPNDWTGSDHGTTIFLERPVACYRPGYPSSSRGFEPDVPRIEVFYGLDVVDAKDAARPCRGVEKVRLLGAFHDLCKTADPARIVLSVSAKYTSFDASELDISLVTTQARLSHDLHLFRDFLTTVSTCKDSDDRLKGSLSTWGKGRPCPVADWY